MEKEEKQGREYNLLTRRLLKAGYTVDNHPDYVKIDVPFARKKSIDNYYGGFTFERRWVYEQTFKTPCGLLCKGLQCLSDMSDALEYDMKNSFVIFPANLKTAHDKVNDLSDKEQALAYDRQIQKMSDELESKYRFSGFGFVIVPPRSAKEIVEEGHTLHHCVGNYVKDVVRRETTILFVREEKEPEKPLCTVEVKNGKVVQARVYKNDAPSPRIRKFLDVWEEKVLRAPVLAKAA